MKQIQTAELTDEEQTAFELYGYLQKEVVFHPVRSQLTRSLVNSMMNWRPLVCGATEVGRIFVTDAESEGIFGFEVSDADAESRGGYEDKDGDEEGNGVMPDVEMDEVDIPIPRLESKVPDKRRKMHSFRNPVAL